ncbi:hypothetical protein [Sulfurimonas sp. CVO]|uniref:hypothetical protein n=1 Tax=Sulfurimonas sp. CVO TaxID=2283483 RepID=UPI00165FF306|nr:hypothetical protein [Sulfurimonas sp. CVO]
MLKKGEVKMIHKMLKDGLSKSSIARKLGISRDTFAHHLPCQEVFCVLVQFLYL